MTGAEAVVVGEVEGEEVLEEVGAAEVGGVAGDVEGGHVGESGKAEVGTAWGLNGRKERDVEGEGTEVECDGLDRADGEDHEPRQVGEFPRV